jgi:hypothetical protein
MLREARERKGVSLAEAEKETRIRQGLIKALEEEDYTILPDRIYTKGLLKNYAHYLGLDTSEVMRLFGEEEVTPTPIPPASQALGSPPFLSPDLIVILAIFMALGLLGFWGYRQYLAPILTSLLATPTVEAFSPTPEATATRTPLPSPSPTFTPTEVVISGLRLEIEILTRTWLEVVVDGEEAFQGLLDAGETQSWSANEVIALHLGNAAGVRAVLCGQEMPPLGGEGEVVDVEWRECLTPTPAIGPLLTPAETPTMTATPTITATFSPSPIPIVSETPTMTATPTITTTLSLSPTPTE